MDAVPDNRSSKTTISGDPLCLDIYDFTEDLFID